MWLRVLGVADVPSNDGASRAAITGRSFPQLLPFALCNNCYFHKNGSDERELVIVSLFSNETQLHDSESAALGLGEQLGGTLHTVLEYELDLPLP